MTSHNMSLQRPPCQRVKDAGFTLVELIVAVAILGVLAAIVTVAYSGYIETTKVASARNQIIAMSLVINDFYNDNKVYPDSLAEVGMDGMKDPWGNPYHYLNIATANVGQVRKDHNLVPLNTDYDLYSSGKDGQSAAPLTAKSSQDDVVRANNGGFVGLASDY
jgi:general secretion pathway protein G